MTTPRKPQDRKPKQAAPKPFAFELAGDTYTFPHPSEIIDQVPAELQADMEIDPEDEETAARFTLALLRAGTNGNRALWKLLNKHRDQWRDIVTGWMQHYADEGGVTLPEGSGSED